MKKKKQKKITKYYYIQDWGSYRHDTIIFVNYNKQEIIKILKKYKKADELRKEFEKQVGDDLKNYCFFHNGFNLMRLKKWENSWDCFETLIHEIHHLIFFRLGIDNKMEKECEAQAYQFEYLFRNIRRKLNKAFKI